MFGNEWGEFLWHFLKVLQKSFEAKYSEIQETIGLASKEFFKWRISVFNFKSTQTSHGKIDNTPITDEPIFSLAPYFLCNFFGLK